MTKKLALTLALFLSGTYLWAEEQSRNPDHAVLIENTPFQEETLNNYFSLVFDGGLAFIHQSPKNMEVSLGSSHIIQGSFYYNIPILKSHWTLSPGIGILSETYYLKGGYTLARSKQERRTILPKASNLLPNNPEIISSMIQISYLDLVTEIRFNSNYIEPQNGFFVALGAKLGIRPWAASSVIEYKEDNEAKSRITQESFNFNRLHYGLIARTGWGRFGAFYSHTLSNLFNDQGLSNNNKVGSLPFSLGFSLNLL